MKPPSEEWYRFAERIELETRGDAGAGHAAEEFLPSFWSEEPETESSVSSRHSWFWPGILIGAIVGSLFAVEFRRRSRDQEEKPNRNREFGTSGTYDKVANRRDSQSEFLKKL
ncbi:MAG TPA: hypothetical protein VI636_17645 [Candidatus Angelobacter sp.]